MIYVSYATEGIYEGVMAKYLHPTLHRWGLEHDIVTIPDPKSWQMATHYKATFLKKMLEKHQQPVVFIDADGTIEQYPMLLGVIDSYAPTTDIALHLLDWYYQWRHEQGNPKREYLTGTLYLGYNAVVMKLLDTWIDLNNKDTDLEQRHLQLLLEKSTLMDVYNLPANYCVIPMCSGKLPYHYLNGEKPIILHHQVSRLYKNTRT